MKDGSHILKTFGQLSTERKTIETNWHDAYRLTFPLRGQNILTKNEDGFTNANNAAKDQAGIFDTTGSDAARLLASSMLSGLTPPNSRWFNLAVPDVDAKFVPQDVKEWLQTAAGTLFTMIHSSNYDSEAFEFMLDMVVGGIAGLYMEMDDDNNLLFESWPLDGLYVQETLKRKIIDTVYRELQLTAGQAATKFGKNNLPEKVAKQLKDDPDSNKKFSFVHAIRPRIRNGKQAKGKFKKTLPWESIYVCKDSKKIVYESGYHEFPVAIPRWLNIPKTSYAVGPVDTALPDLKTLNKIVQMMLTNAEMQIAGTFVAKNDGVINPNTIRIGARRIIFAADTNNIKPLASGGNFGIAASEIDRLQRQIKRVLMSDQLTPDKQAGAMTATEVRVRVQLIRQMLGPVYARFQTEYLQMLIVRTFGLAFRAGKLGQPPEEIIDTEFKPKYDSPLARAQKLEEVQSQDEFEANLAEMAQIKPELLDLYDFDKAARSKADKMGIPIEFFRTDREVEQTRKQRAEQQAQQEQQAMMLEAQQTGGGQ